MCPDSTKIRTVKEWNHVTLSLSTHRRRLVQPGIFFAAGLSFPTAAESHCASGAFVPRCDDLRQSMADVLTKEQRRVNMSRIRGRDTQPELVLRRGLHRRGLRYRLHVKDLPGTPDLVFPRTKAVILFNGCFWHLHNCPRFKWPETRQDFWRAKIERNRERDTAALQHLKEAGWRVQVVWECALRGPGRRSIEEVFDLCEAFVRRGHGHFSEVAGDWGPTRRAHS